MMFNAFYFPDKVSLYEGIKIELSLQIDINIWILSYFTYPDDTHTLLYQIRHRDSLMSEDTCRQIQLSIILITLLDIESLSEVNAQYW